MEKQTKRLLGVVALVTVLILMVPLIAMQFSSEVDWKIGDFIIMGALIFGTGASFVLITRVSTSLVFKVAMGLALGTTFLMIWANLAVGLIASGANLGNLMYMGVVAVVIIGTISSHFTAKGMERAMYASTLALVLLAIIALLANMDEYPGSSVNEIIAVNGFFATLYAVSGSLFRFVAQEELSKKSEA